MNEELKDLGRMLLGVIIMSIILGAIYYLGGVK